MDSAMTVTAQNNQLGILGSSTHLLARPAFRDSPLHRELEALADHGGQRLVLELDGSIPGLARADGRRTCVPRPHCHRAQPASATICFSDSPLQRSPAALGTVDPTHDHTLTRIHDPPPNALPNHQPALPGRRVQIAGATRSGGPCCVPTPYRVAGRFAPR